MPPHRRWINDVIHFGKKSHVVGSTWRVNPALLVAARAVHPPLSSSSRTLTRRFKFFYDHRIMDGFEVFRVVRDVEATMNRDLAAELSEGPQPAIAPAAQWKQLNRGSARVFDDAHHVGHDPVQFEVLRRVDLGDAGILQGAGILRWNNAADHDRHVVDAGLLHARHDVVHQRQVRPGQNRKADDVHVLFRRRSGDRLRRQTDAVIDNFHAGVAGASGDLLGAVGVAVEARLADQELQAPAELP